MAWQKVTLGKLLAQRKQSVSIDPGKEYSLVTISNRGIVRLREKKKGALIKATTGSITRAGDFIYSRLSVHTGAFGIVPADLDGALVTNEMPCFIINAKKVLPDMLLSVIGSPQCLWQMKQLTKGVGRVRIRENMMLSIETRLPSLDEQKTLARMIVGSNKRLSFIYDEIAAQKVLLAQYRQAVLKEAIEGKLTADWREENPDVEPASELLGRIAREKSELVKQKKIKKQKPLPEITENDTLFDIPDTWQWCRLGDYALFERGKFTIRPRNDPRCFGGDYPFIQIGSLDTSGSMVFEYTQTLNKKGLAASKMFPKGTIMIAIVGGTIGNLGVLGIDMCFPDSIVGVKPTKYTCQKYILTLLRHYQPAIQKLAYQMAGQPNIKLPTLTDLICALPPLVEQEEIVRRVEAKFALCDVLEAEIQQAEQHTQTLSAAILQEFFDHTEG